MRKQMESWVTEKNEDFVTPWNKGNKAKVISFCNPVKPAVFMDKKPSKLVTEALPYAKPNAMTMVSQPVKTHEPADLPELWGYYTSVSMEREMAQWELEALEDFIACSQKAMISARANRKLTSDPVMRQTQLEAWPMVKAPEANRKHHLEESGVPPTKIHINRNHPRFCQMFQW